MNMRSYIALKFSFLTKSSMYVLALMESITRDNADIRPMETSIQRLQLKTIEY